MNTTQSQVPLNGRKSLELKSKSAQVIVDIAGGSIASFQLNNQKLNPLTWGQSGAGVEPRPMGHFLCLDRWGPPSESEKMNGMPFHGEASQVIWQVGPQTGGPANTMAHMSAKLPLAGLEIHRTIKLSESEAFYSVEEKITNTNKLGRNYNIVQHATIGPPFLDAGTVVDSNAGRGFMQTSPLPNPESIEVKWPRASTDGKPVDMRRLTDDPNPNVVSYVIDGEFGWVTAINAEKRLLVGYVWRTADYPWFNAWRDVQNGKPSARGLEFGTTGLHQPFPMLVRKGKIFGRPLLEYLDAQETRTKSFASFLFTIPADFVGVGKLEVTNGQLILTERDGGRNRRLEMKVGNVLTKRN